MSAVFSETLVAPATLGLAVLGGPRCTELVEPATF